MQRLLLRYQHPPMRSLAFQKLDTGPLRVEHIQPMSVAARPALLELQGERLATPLLALPCCGVQRASTGRLA